jgi:hypothetical protein
MTGCSEISGPYSGKIRAKTGEVRAKKKQGRIDLASVLDSLDSASPRASPVGIDNREFAGFRSGSANRRAWSSLPPKTWTWSNLNA